MSETFKKKKEDFTCENCGLFVRGNGYTNHCPACLFSKHVDIYPGDRGALCLGLMKPVSFVKKGDEYIITHSCIMCGTEKKNTLSPDDNFEALLRVVQ